MTVTTNLFRHVQDVKTYTAGQPIFEIGDYGETMFVVVEGEVVLKDQRGESVEVVGPGGMFGEMALIDNKPRSLNAFAKSDCKLAEVDYPRFTFMIQQTPFFALHVMQVLAERLRMRGG
jgi:CRP-like cAMP-binding protein